MWYLIGICATALLGGGWLRQVLLGRRAQDMLRGQLRLRQLEIEGLQRSARLSSDREGPGGPAVIDGALAAAQRSIIALEEVIAERDGKLASLRTLCDETQAALIERAAQ